MMMIHPRPSTTVNYPPFKDGRYFEEYFHDFYTSTDFTRKERFVLIDVFWHNMFNTYGVPLSVAAITPAVIAACKAAAEHGQTPFTICQWDDGPCLGAAKPDNLVVFSLGQAKDVALPLIVEDRASKLLSIPRVPLHEKTILCSFVGTITHTARAKMHQELEGVAGFEFHTASTWTAAVPDDKAALFVQVTRSSRFALAPRGYGPSSFRFWEALQLGTVPVYVHDDTFALPFTDVIDYASFAICVHINDITTLPARLAAISDDEYESMVKAGHAAITSDFTMLGTCQHVVRVLQGLAHTTTTRA
jgi:hypothetical protein